MKAQNAVFIYQNKTDRLDIKILEIDDAVLFDQTHAGKYHLLATLDPAQFVRYLYTLAECKDYLLLEFEKDFDYEKAKRN